MLSLFISLCDLLRELYHVYMNVFIGVMYRILKEPVPNQNISEFRRNDSVLRLRY